jgi:hypothetical protein
VACNDCPKGKFQPSDGQNGCISCAPGTATDVIGSVSCTDCEPGSATNLSGQQECTACAAGTSQPAPGQTECVECAAGTFQALSGQTTCDACAADTFQDLPGSTSCQSCAAGFEQPATSQASCLEIAGTGDMKCWKAKDLKNPKFVKIEGQQLDDQFANQNVDLKRPFLFCSPADTGSGSGDSEFHQCCYKIKGDKLNPPAQVETVGTLGNTLQLEVKKPFLLCEPCTRTLLP